uniref:Uncharacterized protein n=1 Tax=Neobodo designis TaxID=312471 RepID=A0A7S1W2A9_NEODS|mmetsp:Transcript_49725/g.153676  ORF Transcript_49725/g.153676 Transcript_49725/m.153676 type:complete len:184 (+) Transcript_49725:37-588(+)
MGDPFVRPGVACDRYAELVYRNPGTGHSDTTVHEWLTQQHRDTLASLAGHPDRVLYLSVAQNTCAARTRHALIEQLAGDPCGPAPKRARDQLLGASEADVAKRAGQRATASTRDQRVTAEDVISDDGEDDAQGPDSIAAVPAGGAVEAAGVYTHADHGIQPPPEDDGDDDAAVATKPAEPAAE